ncbi:hypothetical protein GALMADRAFT_80788 [Galerina marginata CBS 339.88]|uniref:Calcineurin-like phosphoesterase domain-containing protein n=1 Tax=Galerina marginata (strain CBS 339.88) TaxID=685588 RepID=A0A067SIB1_GALM3|nr:hypothetical protein GALMADRAFT_80788 [Galerina marginata CBS 339.88]
MSTQAQGYQDVVFKASREIVYLEYTPSVLPAKPSDDWTRFVCVSDTHSRSFEVPDGDVLLHSGDLTNHGTVADFKKTMDWLYGLPHKLKIIIAGNHDLTLHADWYEKEHENWHKIVGKQDLAPVIEMIKGEKATKAGIVYLEDEDYAFRTRDNGKLWTIYGSPWSPEFFNLAFNYSRTDAQEVVSKFPKTDILLTHGPAHQIFDRITRGDDVGCEALRTRLAELRPRLHLAGHIHEAHGAYIHTWASSDNFEPPTIQNDDPIVSTSQNISDDPSAGRMEQTVFVNAANWPMGEKATRDGVKSSFGGPGFQAVVVDLKD